MLICWCTTLPGAACALPPQLWQVLPLVPPEDTYWSPYSGLDALCGNPLMIDLEDLVVRGLLDAVDLPQKVGFSSICYP